MSDPTTAVTIAPAFSADQVALLKRTVAKGATDDELRLFAHVCRKTGLDPFVRQIHAVKRWDADAGREVMTIQTGIDGLRLIAERTGKYAPGREPTFTYLDDGTTLVSATAYVKKRTDDGTWHEVAATARFDEYAQRKKGGELTSFWKRMPHGQLAKCAEALALRRAHPMETSGVYSHEEMAQAADAVPPPEGPTVEFKGERYPTAGITQATFDMAQAVCRKVGKECAANLLGQFGVEGVLELTEDLAAKYLESLQAAVEGQTTGATEGDVQDAGQEAGR